nr:YdcF family protein [Hasllibacter sp. MH4015]
MAVEWAWPRSAPQGVSADTIICLGGGASDGRLFASSRTRAERCVELYLAGAAPQIVFTGVQAAEPMADLARASGVPAEVILVETQSRSTLQNALFSSRIMTGTEDVLLVSSAYHLPRSWLTFRLMGYDRVTVIAAEGRSDGARPLFREALAIWFNAARYGMWRFAIAMGLGPADDLLI